MAGSHDGAVHPYYPLDLIVEEYTANERSVASLVTIFATVASSVALITLFTVLRNNPRLKWLDVSCIVWFVLTGSIHVFFEGYFVLNSHRMPSRSDLFGQLWKEYSLSDSRYMASDSFVICVETITVLILGPTSYLAAYLIAKESPWRHCAQAFVSVCHIYSGLLYYATSFFDYYEKGISHCRPEAFYFWLYYFFMNFVWILIPTYLVHRSAQAIAAAFRLSVMKPISPKHR